MSVPQTVERPPSQDPRAGTPERRGRIGIAWAVVLLVALVLAPVLALAVGYAASLIRLQQAAVDRGLQGTAHALSLAVDREAQTVEAALIGLASSPSVDSGDWRALHAQAKSVAERFSGWVVLTAPSMQQIINTLRPYGEQLPTSSSPETMHSVFNSGQTVITNLIWGRVSQRNIVAVVAPVMRDGVAAYCLDMTFLPDRFGWLLADHGLPQGWIAMLVDRNNVVVATSKGPAQQVGEKAAAALIAATEGREAGVVDAVRISDQPLKLAFQRSAQTGWKTIVASPMTVIEAPTHAWQATLGIGALGSLLVACALAVIIGRWIAAPLQALAEQAGPMVRGETVTLPESSIREVAAVQTALSEAAMAQSEQIETRIRLAEERKAREAAEQAHEAIRFREEALRFSEERYRGLTEAIASIVWTLRPDGAATDLTQWCNITGQTAVECAGFGWLQALHPEDREHVRARWQEALRERSTFDAEYRLHDASGRYVWYDARAVPLMEADGGVREWVGVCIDIDGRKTAEERQALLAAELSHRVRNILASVQGIIGLTAQNAPSLEEFTKSLQGRVSALARTHALLTGEQWRGASLSRIIRDELQPYVEGDGEQVVVTGHPDCILPPRQALDLALVAHELATNAVKYGALSAADGRISIDWHIDGIGEDTQLKLTWQESGGPTVEQPFYRGFGTRLLEKVLGKTADSNLQLDFLPEGVRCHLVMRLRGQEVATDDKVLHHPQPQQQQQQEALALLPSSAAARVLVAEDEHLAALELARILTDAGLHVVGPASTVREAMELARGAAIAAGVFDVNLNGEMIFPVADLLIARGAPVVLVTGYDTDTPLPERYRSLAVLRKPVNRELLLKQLGALLMPHKAAGEG